jgi:hypothetical protein
MRHLLLALFIIVSFASFSASTVHAEVVCASTTQITSDASIKTNVALEGNNLLWYSHPNQLLRYDLSTGLTTTVSNTVRYTDSSGVLQVSFAMSGDHIVYVDTNQQVQMYKISTGTTTQLSSTTKPISSVYIDENFVVWTLVKKNRYNDVKYHFFVYDITNGATTRFAKKQLSDFVRISNGKVFWNEYRELGGTPVPKLYDIAIHTTTQYEYSFILDFKGEYAIGYRDINGVRELFLINLSRNTAISIVIFDQRTLLESAVISGDHVLWTETYSGGSDTVGLWLYNISTRTKQKIQHPFKRFWYFDGRFIAGFGANFPQNDSEDNLWIYDIPSEDSTLFADSTLDVAHDAVIDENNIAWIGGTQEGWGTEIENRQIFLRTKCASTPHIVDQTSDLNVITGRTVTLSVTAKSDQPITYQWYQGETGDTSISVGDNSDTFVTPPISTPSSFWVRVSNSVGSEDSQTITLNPSDNAELLFNGSFEDSTPTDTLIDGWDHTFDVSNVCNPSTAHTGNCAARFVASKTQTIQASQMLPAILLVNGDTLTLNLWVKSTESEAKAKAVLRIRYMNSTPTTKVKLSANTGTYDYTLLTAEPVTINGITRDVTVKVQVKPGEKGEYFFDDVSVVQQAGTAGKLVPLP